MINYKTRTQPWSVGGGEPGVNNIVVRYEGTERQDEIGFSTTFFEMGETITNLTGGGGGWGRAWERAPERVARDVREGYVSVEAARRDYGVVIDPSTLSVDEAATQAERAQATAS